MFGISKELLKRFGKYLIGLAVILILASILIRTCARKRDIKEVGNEAVLNHEINTDKAKLVAIEAREEMIRAKITTDSIKHINEMAALKRENRSLKKQLATIRPQVDKIADSIPVVKEFVNKTDSLDIVQEAEKDTLIAYNAKTFQSFNALLNQAEEKNRVQVELNGHYQDLNKQLTKQVKREHTRKTFFKIACGVLATGIIYQSINN